MILALDVGNSQIFGGVFEQGALTIRFRKPSQLPTSSDELGLFLRGVLRENGGDPAAVRQITLCSVVPEIIYSLRSCCRKYFAHRSVHPAGGRQDRPEDRLSQSAGGRRRPDRERHRRHAPVSRPQPHHRRPRNGDHDRRRARRPGLRRRHHPAGPSNPDGSAGEEHRPAAQRGDRPRRRARRPLDGRMHPVRVVFRQSRGARRIDAPDSRARVSRTDRPW